MKLSSVQEVVGRREGQTQRTDFIPLSISVNITQLSINGKASRLKTIVTCSGWGGG